MSADSSPPPDLGKSRAERAAGAVLPAAGAVWTAAWAMHEFGCPSPLEAAGAASLAWALSWGAAGRGNVPPGVPAWVAVAGGWLAAAGTFGPLALWPAVPLTAAWAVIAARAAWAARRHEAVVSAREWREERAGWLGRSHDWGLGGTHLLAFERTPLGELYTVSVKGTRKLASAFATRHHEEYIAQQEDLPPGRVQIARHTLAGRITVSVRRIDPWAEPLLHPLACEEPTVELPPVRSILDEALVGQDPETGVLLAVPLYDETGGKNVSVTSIKGGGKTVLFDDLSEHVTEVPDALMARINVSVKGYAEAESWGPACWLTAFGPDQKPRAAAVLKVVAAVIEWRSRTYKRGQYVPSPEDPAIVLFIDESDSSAEVPAIRKGINDIATKGREYGVTYIHAGQRATRDYSDPKARSQDDVYCTGMVRNANEDRRAGTGTGPSMAAYGEGKPGVWKIERLGGGQQAGRTWVFHAKAAGHGAEVERIAQERAFSQPELPAACAEYLGDAYAALLADEVFTRWAHARDAGSQAAAPDDGVTATEAAPAEAQDPAPGTAPALPARNAKTAVADPLEEMWKMNLDEGTRTKLDALHKKLGDAREALAGTAALPRPPQVSPEALAAHTAERWRQVGEDARIPEESRPRLLEMLGSGTTIGAVAEEFGLTKPVARGWLQKYRNAGAAYVDGERKGARWRLATPPGDAAAPPGEGDDQLTPSFESPLARAGERPRARRGDEI